MKPVTYFTCVNSSRENLPKTRPIKQKLQTISLKVYEGLAGPSIKRLFIGFSAQVRSSFAGQKMWGCMKGKWQLDRFISEKLGIFCKARVDS